MGTPLLLLFRVVTFLFAVGAIGSAFVLILTFLDDVKVLFEKPHAPQASPAAEAHSDTLAHARG